MVKDVKKLEEEAIEGLALRQMTETRGWKILLEKFIKPRNSVKRFLLTKTIQERNEAHGALSELDALMSFLEVHIKEGQGADAQLEALKKQGRT